MYLFSRYFTKNRIFATMYLVMVQELKKSISFLLLFVLAWSCFGLNLGMIGHSFMQNSGMQHAGETSTMHDCCIAGMEGQDTQSASTMDHHMLTSVIVKSVEFSMLAVVLLSLLSVSFLLLSPPVHTSLSLYIRRWRRRLLYFALHLQRLFSQGILHPKTW